MVHVIINAFVLLLKSNQKRS